jgi:hypothetical protein
MTQSHVRIVIPDSHGMHIDWPAAQAMLTDIKRLCPKEVVLIGDHLDCAGTFSAHQRSYTNEMAESYEDDVSAANLFLDKIQRAAPGARYHYIEGNHEAHVERWASRTFLHKKDADGLLDRFGPAKVLRLKEREIRYYRRAFQYMHIPIPGTIKLGKCYFTHGISAAQYATAVHLRRFGANVVHGHTHRSQAVVERSVTSAGYGAWCPGTLAKLQPLYAHTSPTSWSHGYGVQFVEGSGKFLHINVPIAHGKSLLGGLLK